MINKQSVIKYSYKYGVKKYQFNLINTQKQYIDGERRCANDISNVSRRKDTNIYETTIWYLKYINFKKM